MKSKIMEITDERETQRKERQKRTRPGGVTKAIVKV